MVEFNRDSGKIKNFERTPEGYLKAWIPVGVANKILEYGDRKETIQLDALTSDKTANTIVGKPVTLNHPPSAINASNYKKYAIGSFLQEHNTDNNVVYHAAIITDTEVADKIESGEYKYVSSGYYSNKKLNTDGILEQLDRSYNHGSILTPENQPRAGEESKIFLQKDSLDLTEKVGEIQPNKDSEVISNEINIAELTEDSTASNHNVISPTPDNQEKASTNKRPSINKASSEKPATNESNKSMNIDAKEIADRVELISEWKSILSEEGVSINYDSTTKEIKKQILSCYYPKELLNGLNVDSIDGFWLSFVTEHYEKRETERQTKKQINKDSKNPLNYDANSLRQEYVKIVSGY